MLLLLFLVASLAKDRYSLQVDNPAEFALQHNLHHIADVAGFSIFEPKSHHNNDVFLATPGLHKDKKRKQYTRKVISDPLYPSQWHLHDNAFSVGIGSVTGKGVNVAIVDDGLQHSHPDLAPNYNAALSYDFNGHDKDPNPNSYDGHGTACAGVCCAAQNNVCGRGVAPEASIVGIRLIAESVYDYMEAQGLTHKNDKIRIYSSSWGPSDSGMDMVEPGRVTKAALRQGFESGDSIFVWAGGNGRQSQDSSNYDGYANSPYTLAIGAIDHNGKQSYYSEEGANLIAVAPSSGANKGITTTDLMGRDGYSSGQCTHRFGGTSSAAPLAAGVIALMLQVRPELRVRDIQHIIARRASKAPRGGRWSEPNARGYTHCNEFGFGLLKVVNLLAEARIHTLVPHPMKRVESPTLHGDSMPAAIHIRGPPRGLDFIEQVLVTIKMSHRRRGQVRVSLDSPHTTSILAKHRGDLHHGSSTWTYSTMRHWGETLTSTKAWQVRVTSDGYEGGSVESVKLEWLGY